MTKPVLSRRASFMAGGLAVYLLPKLANDAKIDLPDFLKGLSSKNAKTEIPKIAAAITTALDGKLAKDATLADIGKQMDAMADMPMEEGLDADPSSGLPMSAEEMQKKTMDNDPAAVIRQLLAGKVAPEVIEQVCAAMGGGAPRAADAETAEEKAAKEKKEAEDKHAHDAALVKNMVSKDDLEKAVKLASDNAIKTQQAIRDAEKDVRPYIGELATAHDSAEAIYRTTLTSMENSKYSMDELKDLPLNALKAILKAIPVAGRTEEPRLATDAASMDSYAKRFPGAGNIRVMG